jgi:mannose-6-phosphate isomerase-like protein (cupin superfamily)
MNTTDFQTMLLGQDPNYVAPDGSEIRLLPELNAGGLSHCSLGLGKTSLAVVHQTVEEIWYVLSGTGEMWRRSGEHEEIITMAPGVSLTIPVGTSFQFRATGNEELRIIISTMPRWPGKHEAVEVPGLWPSE